MKEWRPIDTLLMHLGAERESWAEISRKEGGCSTEILRMYDHILLKTELIAQGKEDLIK